MPKGRSGHWRYCVTSDTHPCSYGAASQAVILSNLLFWHSILLLAWGRGNGTKRKIVSNSPYEGEYARIRSNIVVRYQGSLHGLIFTHKNGPIFLTASKPSIGRGTVKAN